MTDEWLTIPQVATELQVSEETVRRWIRAGTLSVLSLPGGNRAGYRIGRDDLARFIAAHYGTQKTAPEPKPERRRKRAPGSGEDGS